MIIVYYINDSTGSKSFVPTSKSDCQQESMIISYICDANYFSISSKSKLKTSSLCYSIKFTHEKITKVCFCETLVASLILQKKQAIKIRRIKDFFQWPPKTI